MMFVMLLAKKVFLATVVADSMLARCGCTLRVTSQMKYLIG
jgi:hypothetical protein